MKRNIIYHKLNKYLALTGLTNKIVLSEVIPFGSNFTLLHSGITDAYSVGSFTKNIDISYTGQYQVYAPFARYLYLSDDYGSTLTPSSNIKPNTTEWYDIRISGNGQYILACSDPDKIHYKSDDYGASFTSFHVYTGLTHCDISNSGQYQVMGGVSTPVCFSNDYGSTWITGSTIFSWNSVHVSDGGIIYAHKADSTDVYKSIDGLTYTLYTQPTDLYNQLYISPDTRYWTYKKNVADDWMYSNDYGLTFNDLGITFNPDNYDMSIVNYGLSSLIALTGTNYIESWGYDGLEVIDYDDINGLYISEDGAVPQIVISGDGLVQIIYIRPGSTNESYIYRSKLNII